MDSDRGTDYLEWQFLNLNVLMNHPGVLIKSDSVLWVLNV